MTPVKGAGVLLRKARPGDCRLVFEWANDPETRAASFHSRRISLEEHELWFAESLREERRRLRIAEIDGAPVGLVRFDRFGADETVAEIAINLAPEQRGRKLAVPVLLAAKAAAASFGFRTLVARIRPENERSVRAFERAGFEFVSRERVAGQSAFRYETGVV
jgi:RimJ/RimL family protein N-acetyltransferase